MHQGIILAFFQIIHQYKKGYWSILHIQISDEIGASHVTFRPGVYPSLKKHKMKTDDFSNEYSKYYSDVLYDNISTLVESSKNVKVCIENYNFTSLTMETVDKLIKNTNISLTWDIAKSYSRNIELDASIEQFMINHIDRVYEIHIHDIVKGFRSHQIVGTGDIDFYKYRKYFDDEKYVTIEVRPREAALESLQCIKNLFLEN